MIAWTRVHAISTALIRSDARQAATSPAINKIVWEHTPTWIKRRKRTRLNRGVASPINYPHVSLISSTRGAPPGCPRGRVASLPLGAPPCASCVGHTRPATWPQCHVVTVRWSRAPRQPPPGHACHVINRGPVGQITPLFRDFNKKINLKITLKFK